MSERCEIRDVRLVLSRPNGEITYLLGAWGVATAEEAAADIRSGRYRYRQLNKAGPAEFFDAHADSSDTGSPLLHGSRAAS